MIELVPFRDDVVPGLDWDDTAPASARAAIEAAGVPMFIRVGWQDAAFAAGALARFADSANFQQVEIGPWGHGGTTFADSLRPADSPTDDGLDVAGQERRLVDFFSRYLYPTESANDPKPVRTLRFATLGTDQWRTVESWPPAGVTVRRWYPRADGALTSDPPGPSDSGTSELIELHVDASASTGTTNRWLAVDTGQAPTYPRDLTDAMLSFASEPLTTDLHILGFPIVTLRLATSGTDGAAYVYLESVDPAGKSKYVTEGCLRFPHRHTTAAVDPRSGVPRSFARADHLPTTPGEFFDLAVELQPISALIHAGERLRVSIAGHDASCFTRYGPAGETSTIETFTLQPSVSELALPISSPPRNP